MAAFRNNFPSYGYHSQQNNQFAQNVPRGTFSQNPGQHFGHNFGTHQHGAHGNMGRMGGFPMQMPQQQFQQHQMPPQQYPQQMGRQSQRPMMQAQMQARQQMPMTGQFQGQAAQPARNMPGMMNMPNQSNQSNMGNMQNVSQMLNPTNDPHVRFEPVPDNMQGVAQATAPMSSVPSNVSQPIQQNQPSAAQAVMGDAMAQRLANLLQGEGNSIVYYGNLVKAHGAQAREKQLINELIEIKRRQLKYATEMYRGLVNSEWGGTEMMTQQVGNLRDGISYALLQESRLLREASQIYADMGGSAAQGGMLAVLHGKIADIAHLMAI